MLYNKVRATGKVNRFAEGSFYLLGNTELVKNGDTVLMKRNNIRLFRSNPLNIRFSILVNIPIVNDDLIKISI